MHWVNNAPGNPLGYAGMYFVNSLVPVAFREAGILIFCLILKGVRSYFKKWFCREGDKAGR